MRRSGAAKIEATLRDLLKRLRILTPPVWPVKVRRVKLVDSNGDCELVKPTKGDPFFRIRISKHLEPEAMFYVLVHEWAHALSWGSDSHRIEAHGPEWGIAMSRIWQQLLED